MFRIHDWTDAYANAPNIPGGDRWPDAWVKPAEAFRDAHKANSEFDVAYGDHERERFDLFLPHDAEGEKDQCKGLIVFVHGGFWIRLDKSYWSHLAAGSLKQEWAVMMPSYPLCPDVRVKDIAKSVAQAIALAAGRVAGPIRLAGHSAGGQIVTRLISEGTNLNAELLARIERVVSISGVHDLRPLLKTDLNRTIGLDSAEATRESPALLTPLIDASVVCWVGANERSEFVRQNALLANIWRGLGLATLAVEEPDKHHFNVLDNLAVSQSPLSKALLQPL